MTRLKITPGKWVIPSNLKKRDSVATVEGTNSQGDHRFWTVATANSLRDEWEANAEFIAEAGTVANECGLMPRELLAQRDELLQVVEMLSILMSESRGVVGWHLNGDVSEWDYFDLPEKASTAIARVRGAARVPEQ